MPAGPFFTQDTEARCSLLQPVSHSILLSEPFSSAASPATVIQPLALNLRRQTAMRVTHWLSRLVFAGLGLLSFPHREI